MKRRSFSSTAAILVTTTVIAVGALMLGASDASADPDPETSAEIDHLLKFVTDSKATFIRNGGTHNTAEAVEHIKAKRDHYVKKISTTEDFVNLAATKSKLSGRKYQVELSDGTTRENAEWLLEELERHRKAKAAAKEKLNAEGENKTETETEKK